MSFTKTFKKEYSVNGETLKVVYSRMKQKHALQAAPIMEQDGTDTDFTTSLKNLSIASDILKECIVSISGLTIETDSGDTPMSKKEFYEDVLDCSLFMGLVGDMIGDLMKESFMKEEDKKKPESLPQEDSAE